FDVYWNLGQIDLQRYFICLLQRSFILSCMTNISSKYKYSNISNPRNCNQVFHLEIEGQTVRVCKPFFMKVLNISDRVIRTVKSNINEHGILAQDLRGQHGTHVRVDEQLLNDIKQFIDAIPRMEFHYIRQYSTREYIDGGKTITDLFRDFKENQNRNNKAIRVTKDIPFSFFIKTSYKDNEYQEVSIRNRRKKMLPLCDIMPINVYTQRQELSDNKKK
ncbi:uncharacterized protein LOC106713164, partial [Papilio machaon]|uniref:uncharacterized protein LOC106713164 n=1 Tax=Papilio machaon TaxID=76193 RepID=UPI001E664C6D